jgi:hypothetical protein
MAIGNLKVDIEFPGVAPMLRFLHGGWNRWGRESGDRQVGCHLVIVIRHWLPE